MTGFARVPVGRRRPKMSSYGIDYTSFELEGNIAEQSSEVI